MKKIIYISAFVVLGILLQQMLHAGLEIWYLNLLLSDFEKYSLGYSWSFWYKFHGAASIFLFIAGAWLGFLQGRYWWPKLYDETGKVLRPKFWRI